MYVVIDIIQRYVLPTLINDSHASPNIDDGLNCFDGSNHQYFAEGEAGEHRLWGSKCFDYKKREVVQFLLGQLLYFVEEYHIDGFRFDGVTSMMYNDHAICRGFNGDYRDYFGFHSNVDSSNCVNHRSTSMLLPISLWQIHYSTPSLLLVFQLLKMYQDIPFLLVLLRREDLTLIIE